MKRTIVLIIGVLSMFPAYAQFQLSYGTERNEVGNSVRLIANEKGFIIGGYTDYAFISQVDATLLKTKYDGSIIWSKVYGGEANDYFNSVRPITQEEDAGYVCLGTTNSFGYGTNDMLFVRTDQDGIPLTAWTYGGERGDEGHCIQVVQNEETNKPILIMIGESASYTDGAKMFVIKTDLDGNYLDGALIGYKGSQFGYWIEQTKDGGYIAVGANDFACGTYDDKPNLDIFIVKLKPDLNVEWARTIGGGPSIPLHDVAYSVKEIEKGYIITGSTSSFGINYTNDAFLLKIDVNGNLLWLKSYGYDGSDVGYDVLSEEYTGINHQYILTGYTEQKNSNYALLLATDYNGNIMWTRGYGMEGYQYGYEIDKTLRPGYVFTGLEASFGAGMRSIYHVTTDDIGNSNCPYCEVDVLIKSERHPPCIDDLVEYIPIKTGMRFEIKNLEVKYKTIACGYDEKSANNESTTLNPNNQYDNKLIVYPNPAINKVIVQYPDYFSYGDLNIYNNTGQQVFQTTLWEQNNTELELDKLIPGIYLINIISKNGKSLTTNLIITP